MPDRHGIALWPGVQGFISCTYTVSHGISPGVAALTIPEQDVSRIAAAGTLVITDGVGTIKIPRCRVIDTQFNGGGGSPRTITLYIADRRWMWKFGRVSGNWNAIDPYPDPDSFPPDEYIASGGPYMPGTYRTAEKLLADCLAALNEVNPLIDPAPVVPVPAQWESEAPAQAMQAICDTLGYRIVYRPALDQVVVVPAGIGIVLPDLPFISGSDGIDPPERPNAIQIVGGDTIYNDYLELEPVTLELDGKVVALDDASYRPSGAEGWETAQPSGFMKVALEHGPEKCALAQQHVWRTFRVKMRDPATQAEGHIDIPRYGRVTNRKQIVLGTQLYGLSKDERGQLRTEPPYIVGSVFYPQSPTRPKNDNVDIGPFGNTVLGSQRIPIRPTVLGDRGLVTFDTYLFKTRSTNGLITSPDLYLRTSFRVRSLAGMIFDQFTAAGVSPVEGDPLCPPEILRRPELVPVVNVVRNAKASFRVDEVTDNLDDLRRAADYYLKAADQQYRLTATSDRTYAGILPLSPDGAIQQVTWSVGGGSPATTRASRNTEHSTYIPGFADRRVRERSNYFWGRAQAQAAAEAGNITSPGKLREIAFASIIGGLAGIP